MRGWVWEEGSVVFLALQQAFRVSTLRQTLLHAENIQLNMTDFPPAPKVLGFVWLEFGQQVT